MVLKRKGGLIRKQRVQITKKGRNGLKPKQKSISKLMKECDALFSKQVRQKYADSSGWIKCFTCGLCLPLKKMQNGHYISRSVKFLRWSENNCRPQCVGCNIFKNGNLIEFRIGLVKENGRAAIEEMESYRHQPMKLTREYLEDLKQNLAAQAPK